MSSHVNIQTNANILVQTPATTRRSASVANDANERKNNAVLSGTNTTKTTAKTNSRKRRHECWKQDRLKTLRAWQTFLVIVIETEIVIAIVKERGRGRGIGDGTEISHGTTNTCLVDCEQFTEQVMGRMSIERFFS